MHETSRDPAQDRSPEQEDSDHQPAPGAGRQHDSLDLAFRFLVGLLALGGDEAARRLQEMQAKLDADPGLWSSAPRAEPRTLYRQTFHLGVGFAKRGSKRLRSGIRGAYRLSLRAAGRAARISGRLGVGYVTRPVRRPLEARLRRWRQEATLVQIEGELEEQQGRVLATGSLAALILEVMDQVAENPELLEFVQHLLSQQGRGMASSVVDNTRSVTLTADDAADGLLRRLLRRTPRGELPPSPVEGRPQTMYEPTASAERGRPDVDG